MNFFETHLDEKLQGNLADALRKLDPTYKQKFLKSLEDLDIDFSRSIDKAVRVKSARDSRLKSGDYVIIGVYDKPDGTKGMVSYQPKVGPLLEIKNEDIIDRDGNAVTVKAFGPLSWTKWLKLMTDVYVINRSEATSLKETRAVKQAYRDLKAKNAQRAQAIVAGLHPEETDNASKRKGRPPQSPEVKLKKIADEEGANFSKAMLGGYQLSVSNECTIMSTADKGVYTSGSITSFMGNSSKADERLVELNKIAKVIRKVNKIQL